MAIFVLKPKQATEVHWSNVNIDTSIVGTERLVVASSQGRALLIGLSLSVAVMLNLVGKLPRPLHVFTL